MSLVFSDTAVGVVAPEARWPSGGGVRSPPSVARLAGGPQRAVRTLGVVTNSQTTANASGGHVDAVAQGLVCSSPGIGQGGSQTDEVLAVCKAQKK